MNLKHKNKNGHQWFCQFYLKRNIMELVLVVSFHCVHSGAQRIVFGSGTTLTVELRKITHYDIWNKQKHFIAIKKPCELFAYNYIFLRVSCPLRWGSSNHIFIKCVCSNLNCRQRLVISCSLWHACSHCVNQGGQKILFGIGINLLVKSSKNYFHLLSLIDLYLIILP